MSAIQKAQANKYNQVLCIELEDHSKEKVLAAIKYIQTMEDVIYAGPDYLMTLASTTSNDPYSSSQWALSKTQLPAAWDITKGSFSVTVGVIDTGIDANHPDFSGRLNSSASRNFTSGSIVSETPTDPNGHGTHVAGIIGARGNNSIGITGVCWNIRMVSLRAFDADGYGYSSHVANAINYAESINIPILNLSARWYDSSDYYDYALLSVIENYSGLLVCAAGNEGVNNGLYNVYPANYQLSNILVVGASTSGDGIASFSNYGDAEVDLFAPGQSILSCYSTQLCTSSSCDSATHYANGYHILNGTSMAAPYVTGVAALLLSIHPELTATELKHIIMESVDVVQSSSGTSVYGNFCVSGGRLNAYNSVASNLTHNFTIEQYNGQKHALVCDDCVYTAYEAHAWNTGNNLCIVCGFNAEGSVVQKNNITFSGQLSCK